MRFSKWKTLKSIMSETNPLHPSPSIIVTDVGFSLNNVTGSTSYMGISFLLSS